MNKIFSLLVLFYSLSAFSQVNTQSKILSCEWKVDQIETFLIVLQRKPFSQQLSNFSESRMIGPGGRYVESYNSKPSLELNPSQCVLRVRNSQFSIPSHRLDYQFKLEQNEFTVTDLSGFGPNMEDQNFVCKVSDPQVILKIKDQCAQHISVDGFIPVDDEFRIDSTSITDQSIQKDVKTGSNISQISTTVSPQ